MYNLLVVDDEMIAARAIARGIDWNDLPLNRIQEAYDYKEALDILQNETIHILITDIEMPEKNGIELLKYVSIHHPDILTLVTTGHAQFDYVQKAMQYGSLSYLLKPLDFNELKDWVRKSIAMLDERSEVMQFYSVFNEYQKQWSQQLPILRERFWQDILNQRLRPTEEQLHSSLSLYDIPVTPDTQVLPILISLEQWHKELTTRDEEIMEYALRNAAQEIILGGEHGQALQDRNGSNVLLVFGGTDRPGADISVLVGRCEQYLSQCRLHFFCSLSCYIGEWSSVDLLPSAFQQLIHSEKSNVVRRHSVLLAASRHLPPPDPTVPLSLPDFAVWQVLLETGKREELSRAHEAWFESIPQETITTDTVRSFYLEFLQVIYHISYANGLKLSELPSVHHMESHSASPLRSFHLLRQWSYQLLDEVNDLLRQQNRARSSIVTDAIAFIEEHLGDDLSREQIADHIHLNSAYFSRLFKKETGVSLSDYILKIRMEKAKVLLRNPHMKISTVAESVGYTHLSHFAKMFRKIIGQTPQEYRKGYLHLHEVE